MSALEQIQAELAAIKARHEASTPGEWVQMYNASNHKPSDIGASKADNGYAMTIRNPPTEQPWIQWSDGSGGFIVAAHNTDVPFLLGALEVALEALHDCAQYDVGGRAQEAIDEIAALVGGHGGNDND